MRLPCLSHVMSRVAVAKNTRFDHESGDAAPEKRSVARYVKQLLNKSPERNAVARRCCIEI